MKATSVTGIVTGDGKVTLQLPPDIPAGKHEFLVVINEKPLPEKPQTNEKRPPLNFPVDNYGPWPENLSLRREDMYGDWGR